MKVFVSGTSFIAICCSPNNCQNCSQQEPTSVGVSTLKIPKSSGEKLFANLLVYSSLIFILESESDSNNSKETINS
jgi:hypothetical protein